MAVPLPEKQKARLTGKPEGDIASAGEKPSLPNGTSPNPENYQDTVPAAEKPRTKPKPIKPKPNIPKKPSNSRNDTKQMVIPIQNGQTVIPVSDVYDDSCEEIYVPSSADLPEDDVKLEQPTHQTSLPLLENLSTVSGKDVAIEEISLNVQKDEKAELNSRTEILLPSGRKSYDSHTLPSQMGKRDRNRDKFLTPLPPLPPRTNEMAEFVSTEMTNSDKQPVERRHIRLKSETLGDSCLSPSAESMSPLQSTSLDRRKNYFDTIVKRLTKKEKDAQDKDKEKAPRPKFVRMKTGLFLMHHIAPLMSVLHTILTIMNLLISSFTQLPIYMYHILRIPNSSHILMFNPLILALIIQ